VNTRNHRDLWKLPAYCNRSLIHTVAFCALLIGGPALAQQTDASIAVNQPDAGTGAVSQSVGSGLNGQQAQPRMPLPDAPSACPSAPSRLSPLTLGERFTIYSHSVLRPYTLVGPAIGAGIGQWENEPPEWGQGAEGYGRRIASGMGRHLIAETIRFGVAATDGEDPRYRRSREIGVWNRTRHAIVETFTSQTESGARVPAYSRFAGTYGAAFIANAWYPESRATAGYALRRGSTALGSSLAFHLFEEFIPQKYLEALHISD